MLIFSNEEKILQEVRPCIIGGDAEAECPRKNFNKAVLLRAMIEENELVECEIRLQNCTMREKNGAAVILYYIDGTNEHYVNKERICKTVRLYAHRIYFIVFD